MSEQLEFPELLNLLQRRSKLTDAALAKRCGFHKSSVGRWKKGLRHPTQPDTVNRLIEALGLEGGDAENLRIAAWRYLGFEPVEATLPKVATSPGGRQRVVGIAHVGVSDKPICEVCGANSKTILGCASCGSPYCQHCMRTTQPFGSRCYWCGFHGFGED